MSGRVFRFAPSPNGRLHLGHARSALLNDWLADKAGGRWLLRIEDIDITRSRPEYIAGIEEDLSWLGLTWPKPMMVQSSRGAYYRLALDTLKQMDLVYPCFATRAEIKAATTKDTERDPEGQPLYPGIWREASERDLDDVIAEGRLPAWRLDMARAVGHAGTDTMRWSEGLSGDIVTKNVRNWGDVILARRDIGTSYHLAVTVDDAEQGVTDIVRGRDLYAATAIHRLLQILLDLPQPRYAHHALVEDMGGDKLSKSRGSRSLSDLRDAGATPSEVIALAGLGNPEALFSVNPATV
ncbi:MAG: tRNA glutamyl-Q(34) synthetase GluQRS [Pseudomonadota bacterium]